MERLSAATLETEDTRPQEQIAFLYFRFAALHIVPLSLLPPRPTRAVSLEPELHPPGGLCLFLVAINGSNYFENSKSPYFRRESAIPTRTVAPSGYANFERATAARLEEPPTARPGGASALSASDIFNYSNESGISIAIIF